MIENRFSGSLWAEAIKNLSCCIVGLGTTGSWSSLLLARAGVQIFYLVDNDEVEYHNIGGMLVPYNAIGNSKVKSAEVVLNTYCDPSYINQSDIIIEECSHNLNRDIVVSALDSMSGRKFIYNYLKEDKTTARLLLDPRLSAEYYELYVIPLPNEEKCRRYEETLFSDAQGNVGACNYQQTSHCAAILAGEITKMVTQWITDKLAGGEDTLPFKITHDLRTNNYGVYY